MSGHLVSLLSPTYKIGGFYRWALIRFTALATICQAVLVRFCTADWLLGFSPAAVPIIRTPLGRFIAIL